MALNLKYGRNVALARTMARYYMAPLRGGIKAAIVVPVPLHRRQLWWRGFNQSGLMRYLGANGGLPVDQHLIRRVLPTLPLKGMNEKQLRAAVRDAFAPDESN